MVLLKRHFLLLCLAWTLSVLARLFVPDERVQLAAALLMLGALGVVARWYVREGPGPYRDSGRSLRE